MEKISKIEKITKRLVVYICISLSHRHQVPELQYIRNHKNQSTSNFFNFNCSLTKVPLVESTCSQEMFCLVLISSLIAISLAAPVDLRLPNLVPAVTNDLPDFSDITDNITDIVKAVRFFIIP